MTKIKLRKWIWLCVWILTLVGISFYGGAVSYGLFWGVLFMPVVSCIYLLCVWLRFRIYQEIESRQLVCGQAMPYYFVLRNEDRFGFAGIKVHMFPDYSYVEDVAEDVEYELLPGDEFLYRTKLVCKYRGEYEVGVKSVTITDFFGLLRLKYPVPGPIRAIVKPKLVKIQGINALTDEVINLEREAFMAQNDMDVVVREYVQGDSLKKMHWKAAARTGRLWVRKETGTEKQGIVLLFDTRRYSRKMAEYLPLESKLLEVLLALTMFLADKGVPVSVYYGQNGICSEKIAGINSFEAFYSRMSGVAFDERESPLATMQQTYHSGFFGDARVCICVFHAWTEDIKRLAQKIADGGVNVLAYVVSNENPDGFVQENTEQNKVVVIPLDADLEGVL